MDPKDPLKDPKFQLGGSKRSIKRSKIPTWRSTFPDPKDPLSKDPKDPLSGSTSRRQVSSIYSNVITQDEQEQVRNISRLFWVSRRVCASKRNTVKNEHSCNVIASLQVVIFQCRELQVKHLRCDVAEVNSENLFSPLFGCCHRHVADMPPQHVFICLHSVCSLWRTLSTPFDTVVELCHRGNGILWHERNVNEN